jgi:hypothetical protein
MDDLVYTVREVSEIIKTNNKYVYSLMNAGVLPYIVLGSKKVLRKSLIEFLEKNEGYDLSDPENIRKIIEEGRLNE